MTAIIFGWNPDLWNSWDYDAVIGQVAERGYFLESWSVSWHRNIPLGADAWLLLQGPGSHGRGLIGHGVVTSEDYEAVHFADERRTSRYVDVEWDSLLPLGSQIRPDVLIGAAPGVAWRSFRESGRSLAPDTENDVRRLWQDFGPGQDPDPTVVAPGTYPGSALTRVAVNRFERDPEARRRCLAFHGNSCAACGLSFEVRYGEAARDFIQVHHTVPPSRLGSRYSLDPVTDLIPLCANCHNVAHLGVSTPRSVAELRELMTAAGHHPGEIVSSAAALSQEDARRILDQH